jgi:hypothetical protein
VDQANVLVRGKTEPNATVTVNGLMVYVSATGEFTAPVALNPGKNKIYITAVDKVGNARTLGVDVNYQPSAVSSLGAGSAITLGLFALLIILVVVIMVLMVMMMKRMGGRKTGKDTAVDDADNKEMTPETVEDDEPVPQRRTVTAPTKAPSRAPTTLPPPLPPSRPVDVKVEPKPPTVNMKK